MPKIVATKHQWIKLGYELFSNSGIRGINVDTMSKALKCNRSSFYWHFQSKEDFLNELIEHWKKTETELIISTVEKSQSPKEKLEAFFKIAFKDDPYLEFIFFLKRYAKRKKDIQVVIDEIDDRRLEYSTKLFHDIGYTKKEAAIKASIFYKYLIGHHEMIRNKKQPKNYLIKVKKELQHFLEI